MDFQELEHQVQDLIAKDRIETAIELLTEYFQQSEDLDAILLLSGRYHSLKKDQSKAIIDKVEGGKILNELRANILDLLRSKEEEKNFKNKIFQDQKDPGKSDVIPVFFSLGTPHKQTQVDFIEGLKSHILKYNIHLITLDGDDWDNLDPLHPIRKKMENCCGCLALAMERSYVKEGVNKRESKQESIIKNAAYVTPWTHIETTLAYSLGLPFLILKEETLKSEGMIDDHVFEWRIVKIDPSTPKELGEYPIKSFIRMWVEEVRKFKLQKNQGS